MNEQKFINYAGERYCKKALYDGLDAVMQKRHIAHNEGHLLYLVDSDLKEYPEGVNPHRRSDIPDASVLRPSKATSR